MNQRFSSAATLVYLGVALIIVSAVVPWMHASAFNHAAQITPLSNDVLRPALVLELAVLFGGAVLVLVKGNPVLVGIGSGIWTLASTLVWLFGARTSMFIPKDALPNGLTVQLLAGASVGMLGGLFCFVGALLILRDLTWPLSARELDLGHMAMGAVVAAALVGAREFPWVQVGSGDWTWRLSVDAVPVLGDFMLLALLAGAVLALVLVVRQSQTVAILGVVVAVVVVGLSVVGFLARGMVTDLASWITHRASFLQDHQVEVSPRSGPLFDLVAGVALGALSAVVLFRHAKRQHEPVVSPQPESAEAPLRLEW